MEDEDEANARLAAKDGMNLNGTMSDSILEERNTMAADVGEIRPNTNTDITQNIHLGIYAPTYGVYCKPTSSKVLVEDMVTDTEDDLHFREHHTSEMKVDTPRKRRFWDRPTIPENMAWPGDARMPLKWNMMTSDVRGIGLPVHSIEEDGESLGPYKFT